MRRTKDRRRTIGIGVAVLAVALAATVAVFQKPAIVTALRPGETLALELARNYKVAPHTTIVKIAGTPVGEVADVEDPDDPTGPTTIGLKLDSGTRDLLGTQPRAEIRPTTVLGGKYYVSLVPGGEHGHFDGEVIPRDRTATPVELDAVLAAVPPDAQAGLRGATERLDSALQAGTGDELGSLARRAPTALAPAGVVLDAARGTDPGGDLTRTVTGLNTTAAVLTRTPGQLGGIVDSLRNTSRVLGTNADPVAGTVATLPGVLRSVRDGSLALAPTLDRITRVAGEARPAVRELDPTLAQLRPVLADLQPLLEDARPLVEQLTPVVEQGTAIVRDVRGPVLDRVNGPVLDTVLTEWHGDGPKYPEGGGTGNLFYQELGYMFANINNSVQYSNATAHMLGFQPGAGTTSVAGTGNAAQDLQRQLSSMFGPPHQEPPLQLPPADGIRLPELGGN